MRSFLVVFLATFAVACGSRAESPEVVPTATSSPAPTATASTAPSATASPTLRPNPSAGPGAYTNVALAYRVALPEGWRRAACGTSLEFTVPAGEAFTSVGADLETFSDVGANDPGVFVRVEDNPTKLTALQWLESGNLGSSTSTRFEKTSFDGKTDAARMVSLDGSLVQAFVVAARGQIFVTGRTGPQATSGMLSSQTSLLSSLHILSDVELAVDKATLASPTPSPARTAEEVADALAKGFAQKDTVVLATIAGPCLQQGNEQAGATAHSASRFLSDLQKSFVIGLLVVTVQPRPIEQQGSTDYATIRGTWKDGGQAQRNVKLMLGKAGNTWYWYGVLFTSSPASP